MEQFQRWLPLVILGMLVCTLTIVVLLSYLQQRQLRAAVREAITDGNLDVAIQHAWNLSLPAQGEFPNILMLGGEEADVVRAELLRAINSAPTPSREVLTWARQEARHAAALSADERFELLRRTAPRPAVYAHDADRIELDP